MLKTHILRMPVQHVKLDRDIRIKRAYITLEVSFDDKQVQADTEDEEAD